MKFNKIVICQLQRRKHVNKYRFIVKLNNSLMHVAGLITIIIVLVCIYFSSMLTLHVETQNRTVEQLITISATIWIGLHPNKQFN